MQTFSLDVVKALISLILVHVHVRYMSSSVCL